MRVLSDPLEQPTVPTPHPATTSLYSSSAKVFGLEHDGLWLSIIICDRNIPPLLTGPFVHQCWPPVDDHHPVLRIVIVLLYPPDQPNHPSDQWLICKSSSFYRSHTHNWNGFALECASSFYSSYLPAYDDAVGHYPHAVGECWAMTGMLES